jgi:ribosomal protein L16 Arg81 hydroxylase
VGEAERAIVEDESHARRLHRFPIEPPSAVAMKDPAMPLTMDRLLEPFSVSEFLDAYYEKQPLLVKRQSPAHYDDLLTLEELNEHLGERHLPSTAFRLARDGKELDVADFTYPEFSANNRGRSATVDKDLLFAKFYDGYTIIIMQYESAAMLRLRHVLERAFHGWAEAHIYLTPANAQGFSPHWDTQDTFILQFTGAKDWVIYDSPITLPTRQQRLTEGGWTRREPTFTATLEPGDLLYLPRGFVHEATSRDSVSGHITFGVQTDTYADLLWTIADNACADAWLRQSLPADFRSTSFHEEFLRRVHEFLDHADVPAYVERMHGDLAENRMPDGKDRLIDYVKLPSVDADSRFRLRSAVSHELTNGGDDVVLTFDRKSLKFPAAAAESIRCMIAAGEFTMRALPGNCEENLATCSTLVREGFLGIVRADPEQ